MQRDESGALLGSIAGFGRALRHAGLPLDGARMALAAQAACAVGLTRRDDVGAALEAVLVGSEQDRPVFREMFEAWFRDPMSDGMSGPVSLGQAPDSARREAASARVREALLAHQAPGMGARPEIKERVFMRDAAMSASDLARLRQADFNALSGEEFRLVQRLARDVRLSVPHYAARRVRPGARGARLHWPGVMRQAARTGGELMLLPRMRRQRRPLPVLMLLDVSGSMERYARMLLAFLHAATRGLRERDLFAFGSGLTDLTPALRLADGDAMLAAANHAIRDFGGGTRLGESLSSLRLQHARRLVGRRSLVLLVSDGLDTGDPQDLARELDWLLRHCRRLLWLNPLLRFEGYAPLARGASVLQAHAHGALAVHNLAKLQDLAASLAALMKR